MIPPVSQLPSGFSAAARISAHMKSTSCAVVFDLIMAHKLTDNKFLRLAYRNVKMGDAQIDGGYDGCFHSRVASAGCLMHHSFLSTLNDRSAESIPATQLRLGISAAVQSKCGGILKGPKYETAVNAGMQQSIDGDIISRLTIRTCDIL